MNDPELYRSPRESAGGVIVGPDGRVVVVEQNGNSWSFPKGGVETGETARQAAEREIYEESGVTELTYVADLGSYERYSLGKDGKEEQIDQGLVKRTYFLYTTAQTELMPHDPESTQARFATIEEAIVLLTHPKDKEFLASVADRVRQAVQ